MFDRLQQLLAEISGVPPRQITRETPVRDLIDSLGLVQLLGSFEEEGVDAASSTVDAAPMLGIDRMTVGDLADVWERCRRETPP